MLPPAHSCMVDSRGNPSEFPRGIVSQSQLSQKGVLSQDLTLSQLKSPTESLSPSVCPEPPGTVVPCSAAVTVLLCSKGDPLRAPAAPQRAPLPASSQGAQGTAASLPLLRGRPPARSQPARQSRSQKPDSGKGGKGAA